MPQIRASVLLPSTSEVSSLADEFSRRADLSPASTCSSHPDLLWHRSELLAGTECTANELISEAIDLLADGYRQHLHAVKPRKRQGPSP